MKLQFEHLGLPFTRVEAIDGATFSSEELANHSRVYSSQLRIGWSNAYLACFLSHFKVWKLIAGGSDQIAAIFEDDVHISDSYLKVCSEVAQLSSGFDILRLETTYQGMKFVGKLDTDLQSSRVRFVKSGAWGAAAYIIKRDIADWLLHSPPRFHYATDYMLFHESWPIARALHIAQLDPAPCVQDQYHPEISRRRRFPGETRGRTHRFEKVYGTLRDIIAPIARPLLGKKVVPYR